MINKTPANNQQVYIKEFKVRQYDLFRLMTSSDLIKKTMLLSNKKLQALLNSSNYSKNSRKNKNSGSTHSNITEKLESLLIKNISESLITSDLCIENKDISVSPDIEDFENEINKLLLEKYNGKVPLEFQDFVNRDHLDKHRLIFKCETLKRTKTKTEIIIFSSLKEVNDNKNDSYKKSINSKNNNVNNEESDGSDDFFCSKSKINKTSKINYDYDDILKKTPDNSKKKTNFLDDSKSGSFEFNSNLINEEEKISNNDINQNNKTKNNNLLNDGEDSDSESLKSDTFESIVNNNEQLLFSFDIAITYISANRTLLYLKATNNDNNKELLKLKNNKSATEELNFEFLEKTISLLKDLPVSTNQESIVINTFKQKIFDFISNFNNSVKLNSNLTSFKITDKKNQLLKILINNKYQYEIQIKETKTPSNQLNSVFSEDWVLRYTSSCPDNPLEDHEVCYCIKTISKNHCIVFLKFDFKNSIENETMKAIKSQMIGNLLAIKKLLEK